MGYEGEQAAMVILRAEGGDTRLAWSLEERNLDCFAVNPPGADFRLSCPNRQQGPVVNRFHESVSQSIERRAQRPDVFGDWDVFLRLRNHGAVVYDGAAGNCIGAVVDQHRGVHEVAVLVPMSDAHLGKLTRGATDGVLMALGARSPVVHRS